jgi:hypothetical protein
VARAKLAKDIQQLLAGNLLRAFHRRRTHALCIGAQVRNMQRDYSHCYGTGRGTCRAHVDCCDREARKALSVPRPGRVSREVRPINTQRRSASGRGRLNTSDNTYHEDHKAVERTGRDD